MESCKRCTWAIIVIIFLIIVRPVNAVQNDKCDKVPLLLPYEIIDDATFAVEFKSFGKVCFVSAFQPDENTPTNKYIGFYLFQNGKKIYDFEKPERYIWSSSCQKIKAVSFRDVNKDGNKDVTIIGECFGAREAYYQPILYFGLGNRFRTFSDFNLQLSEFEDIRQIEKYVIKQRSSLRSRLK